MDHTARFEALVALPDGDIPLDEAALLIAAHADPAADMAGTRAELDRLAGAVAEPSLPALVRLLFVDEAFTGNGDDYYDPANSMLDKVVTRRRGIPITLSVVTIEVGRRIGLEIEGLGMPGHFLVRHRDTVFDPFHGGAAVETSSIDAELLHPVGATAILARMLANLKQIYASAGDDVSLAWVLRLRTSIPGVPEEERHELTRLRARWN